MIQEDRQEDADREMVVRWNLAAMTRGAWASSRAGMDRATDGESSAECKFFDHPVERID
jgi:hypothetical protein